VSASSTFGPSSTTSSIVASPWTIRNLMLSFRRGCDITEIAACGHGLRCKAPHHLSTFQPFRAPSLAATCTVPSDCRQLLNVFGGLSTGKCQAAGALEPFMLNSWPRHFFQTPRSKTASGSRTRRAMRLGDGDGSGDHAARMPAIRRP